MAKVSIDFIHRPSWTPWSSLPCFRVGYNSWAIDNSQYSNLDLDWIVMCFCTMWTIRIFLYTFLVRNRNKTLELLYFRISAVDSDALGVGEVGGIGVVACGIVYNLHEGPRRAQKPTSRWNYLHFTRWCRINVKHFPCHLQAKYCFGTEWPGSAQ